jgi:hypothetical protein
MSYDYTVQYVADSTSFPSMAAAVAMMLTYRDGQSRTESQVLAKLTEIGVDAANGNDADRLAYPLGLNMLTDPCHDGRDWARYLERGPVMVATPSRVFLVAGVEAEDAGDSARLKLIDPAAGGETWMGWNEVKQRYELDPNVGYVIRIFQWP